MKTDLRILPEICRKMIGKTFTKYRCDKFDFTNSVTQIVGLYIGGEVYSLTNIQDYVDYFGCPADESVFRLVPCSDGDVKSCFVGVTQADTPVKSVIRSVKTVNDWQKITRKEDGSKFELWLTRAVIFCLDDGREISFEKDMLSFSEEIIIRRGYDLSGLLSDENGFVGVWDEDTVTAECRRKTVEIV